MIFHVGGIGNVSKVRVLYGNYFFYVYLPETDSFFTCY